MANRIGTARPVLHKKRGKLPARMFTDGSEYSVRERLRRLRSETDTANHALAELCVQFVAMGKSAKQDTRISEAERLIRQRLGRKASSINRLVRRFSEEIGNVSRGIELAYDREQGNLLASMDQVQRVNPTWIDIGGLITNPNQVVVSRRGVGSRKKVASAAVAPETAASAPAGPDSALGPTQRSAQ